MSVLNLSELNWQWHCWRPWMWKLGQSMETGQRLRVEMQPVAATIPGTVQQALLNAGVIDDWNVGTQSRLCEWVEHRHWELSAALDTDPILPAQIIVLDAPGLDYSGWLLIDHKQVGTFCGSLHHHRFGLTSHLSEPGKHYIQLIFDCPPPEQGQIGFTSKTRYFKPRHHYGWDWCPRFVPIGVTRPMRMLTDMDAALTIKKVSTCYDHATQSGHIEMIYQLQSMQMDDKAIVQLTLLDEQRIVTSVKAQLLTGKHSIDLQADAIEPWFPNGAGHPQIYELLIQVIDQHQQVLYTDRRILGFKQVRWEPCCNAREDALPWLCFVNDMPVFLQGVNWTPIRLNDADLHQADYEDRLAKYREMGCNLLRVWGGAGLEKDCFYELCDQMGLMVWQEFPLSSSGIENQPPEDASVIEELVQIATGYVQQCMHHPSLLMWCGGNELTDKQGIPSTLSTTALQRLAQMCADIDPGHRFVATSPTGPRFGANPKEYGLGLHHDVHGPWGWDESMTMEQWITYWQQDDAMMRSEVGMPGASSLEVIQHYCGPDAWPADNDTWRHSAAWWIMWERFKHLQQADSTRALQAYVHETQQLQAKALEIAVNACRSRPGLCGGILIWMGHDCFPCPINNSLIDYEGHCKAAYFAIKKHFLQSCKNDRYFDTVVCQES